MNNNHLNYYNILAMLVAGALAVFIPFELLLLSYAILGPAHYLTEISWLNDRHFFTLKKYDYLFIIAAVITCFLFRQHFANLVFYVFGLSFILMTIKNNLHRLVCVIILAIGGYFLLTNKVLLVIFGLYVPTLVHVYIFTGAFILFGALKDKIVSGYVAFAVFLICPVLLCFLFRGYYHPPTGWAISNYGNFARLNTTILRNKTINIFTTPASIILTRLVAFAYTYHYINWFTKTRVINWHKISVTRMVIIGLIWAASVALYIYSYQLGIKWLFLLSLSHVVLEFPLNHRSFIGIGRQLKMRWVE